MKPALTYRGAVIIDPTDPDTCERCGGIFEVGDYPYCKGNYEDHANPTLGIQTLDYIDPHISTKGPVHITSHAQRRRLMKAGGLVERD